MGVMDRDQIAYKAHVIKPVTGKHFIKLYNISITVHKLFTDVHN